MVFPRGKKLQYSCALRQTVFSFLAHPSCDKYNCQSLRYDVHLEIIQRIPQHCHKYIQVGECIKSRACSYTANPIQLGFYPFQTRLAYLSWDALTDMKCRKYHGHVFRGMNPTCDLLDGCKKARKEAVKMIKYYTRQNPACHEYIVVTPILECALYDCFKQAPESEPQSELDQESEPESEPESEQYRTS